MNITLFLYLILVRQMYVGKNTLHITFAIYKEKPLNMNKKPNFDEKEFGGLRYPIVKRKKGADAIDECPYCGKPHKHSRQLGHHYARCDSSTPFFKEINIKTHKKIIILKSGI